MICFCVPFLKFNKLFCKKIVISVTYYVLDAQISKLWTFKSLLDKDSFMKS